MKIADHPELEEEVESLVAVRSALSSVLDHDATEALKGSVKARAASLLDDWKKLMHEAMTEAAAKRCYSPWDEGREGRGRSLDRKGPSRG
ncbi:MAG: hypothetical protein AAFU79_11005 [Myxococcota bacterium]